MDEVNHFIEREIMKKLMLVQSAHFAQMRPKKVDSNLYSYHLSKLLKLKYIIKQERDYGLTPKGLAYVDRISLSDLKLRIQPKINTGIILKNLNNQVLLNKRLRQPLLGFWGLPMGKIHETDESLKSAAKRELLEITGIIVGDLKRVGGCYLRFYKENVLISSSMSQIFLQEGFDQLVDLNTNLRWVDIDRLNDDDILPGVAEIVSLSDEDSKEFFAEINKVLK